MRPVDDVLRDPRPDMIPETPEVPATAEDEEVPTLAELERGFEPVESDGPTRRWECDAIGC